MKKPIIEKEQKNQKTISNTIFIILITLISIALLFIYFKIDLFLLFISYFSGILIYFIFKELFTNNIIPQKLFII
jgi:hypothetical protein